jgi:hypothetical protein
MSMWNGDKRTIPENCQKLLARMLFETVDCKVRPRADCDWETAGVLLGNHQEFIDLAVRSLAHCAWFKFLANFGVQTTEVDSGGFHEICWHVFWQNFRHFAGELPKDKYENARGFS